MSEKIDGVWVTHNQVMAAFADKLAESITRLLEVSCALDEESHREVASLALAGCLASVLMARGADKWSIGQAAAYLVTACALSMDDAA